MRLKSMTSLLRASLLASAAFLPIAAQAQERSLVSAAGPQDGGVASVDDVIVTARRRSERAIDVPAVITAVSNETLERTATTDLSALGNLVPQVMFSRNPGGNGANINIRGVGTNTTGDDGIDQAVSINIDGVPTARGRILQTGLFDVSNVQVLKGPQALYFGKNSPGGVIVIETNGPSREMEGYFRAGYEFEAHEYSSEAAIGGPLTDTLGFRLAFRGSDMRQGYVRNVAQPISAADNPIAFDRANGYSLPGRAFEWGPQSKQVAARLTLAWNPTDTFSAVLKSFVSEYRDQGDVSQTVLASCNPGATLSATNDLSAALFPPFAPRPVLDPNSVCGGERRLTSIGELPDAIRRGLPLNGMDTEFTENRNYLSSLTLNWALENIDITSVTGFYKFSNLGTSFPDATTFSVAGAGANAYNTTWNQEIRAITRFDSPVNLTLGAFYNHDERRYDVFGNQLHYVDSVTGNSATSAGSSRTEGETLSAFFEANWNILPTVELAAGARYTRETKDGQAANTYASAPGIALRTALPVGVVLTPSVSDENVSPQATLTWRPSRNTTLFAAYRTGFKAGAISTPGVLTPNLTSDNLEIGPEEAKGFEVGFKFQTPDRRISGDIAVYSYQYDDLQVSSFDNVSSSVITKNAGGSEISGVEASLDFRATDQLRLRAAGGYNDAHYSTFTDATCWGGQTVVQGCVARQQDLSGVTLPRAPEFSATAGATYDAPVSSTMMFGATLDARYSSSYQYVATNNPYSIQKSYTVLDGSIRLHGADDSWELALVGKNLTDAFYYVIGSERALAINPGSIRAVPNPPRTVLLQATYRY